MIVVSKFMKLSDALIHRGLKLVLYGLSYVLKQLAGKRQLFLKLLSIIVLHWFTSIRLLMTKGKRKQEKRKVD